MALELRFRRSVPLLAIDRYVYGEFADQDIRKQTRSG